LDKLVEIKKSVGGPQSFELGGVGALEHWNIGALEHWSIFNFNLLMREEAWTWTWS